MKSPFAHPLVSVLAGMATAGVSVALLCAAHFFFGSLEVSTRATAGGIVRGLPPKQMTRATTSTQIGKAINPVDLARAPRDAAEH
jgi:hypothetical protein